jgi:nucleotidyltransferase/DNA polymerase involved in DNA repair
MPSVTATRQRPDLISVRPRFEVHQAVSQQIREIFAEHTHTQPITPVNVITPHRPIESASS